MILAHRWQVFFVKAVLFFLFLFLNDVYPALVRVSPSGSAYRDSSYQPFGAPSYPYPTGGFNSFSGGGRVGLVTRNSYLRPKPRTRFPSTVSARPPVALWGDEGVDEKFDGLPPLKVVDPGFDASPINGYQDAVFNQISRIKLETLENSLDEIAPDDLVEFDHLHDLMDQFERYDIPTKLRLFLLVQDFIVRARSAKGPGLGIKFNNSISALKNRLIECAFNLKWPTAEKQVGGGNKPTILGIQQSHLYEAFLRDRIATHGTLNFWKAYTNPREMNSEFFHEIAAFFRLVRLPGKSDCVAASMLINRIASDLGKFIADLQEDPESEENSMYSAADLNEFLVNLKSLQGHFNEIVPLEDLTVLSAAEIANRFKKITDKLATIESTSSELLEAKDKKYLLSTRLLVLSDLKILLLRGGFGFLSTEIGKPLAKIIERILNLHPSASGAHSPNDFEPSYGTFFLATVDFLYFLDCVAGRDVDFLKALPEKVRSLSAKLKEQYSKWYAVLSIEPSIASEYVLGKRIPSIDMCSKLPEFYKNSPGRVVKIDFLLACLPFVCKGMGKDLQAGVRVYKSVESAMSVPSDLWVVVPDRFDSRPFKRDISAVKLQSSPTLGKIFAIPGISADEMLRSSTELNVHALRWMKNSRSKWYQKIDDAITHNNTFYSENVLSIALAWLETMTLLDEALFLNDKKPNEFGVPAKWESIIDFCENFAEKGTTGRAIGKMLRSLAQTHSYDFLPVKLQKRIKELFEKVSERTKSDPSFSSNLRLADAQDLLGRIRTALSQELNPGYKIQGIATMAVLFDFKRAIIADDLFPLAEAGEKQAIIDVMLKSGVELDALEELIQSVPKKSLDDIDIQTLKAWNIFLTMFFSADAKKTHFYMRFSKNKLKTGVHDLMLRHKKIMDELAKRGDVSSGDSIPALSFELRKTTKIDPEKLKESLTKFFRERSLKKTMLDLEARLMSLLRKSSSVFLYDEGFFGKNTYSLGTLEGNGVRAALLVLRGMCMTFDTNLFKESGAIGSSMAAHLLVPLNYIAIEYGDKMNDKKVDADMSFLIEMFYLTHDIVKSSLIQDLACIPQRTSVVWNSCSLKPKDANELLERFDAAYPSNLSMLQAKLAGSASLYPSANPIAVAINQSVLPEMFA